MLDYKDNYNMMFEETADKLFSKDVCDLTDEEEQIVMC